LEGIKSDEIHKAVIEGKLKAAGCCSTWFRNFQRCGVEEFYLMCVNCQKGNSAFYQCSQRICPRCNWRIANRRRELLLKITKGMFGVKHIVLTQRNFPTLDKAKIQSSRKALLKLRKQKIFGKVRGGCASLEFTNEKRGWHMHWHLLVDADFVPADQLALAWGKLVDQEFAIVKVMNVTDTSYVQEVCKYAAKGSELAKWPGTDVIDFVEAIRGTRMFTTWGNFSSCRKLAEQLCAVDRGGRKICECGCETKIFGQSEGQCWRAIEEGRF
jgi:hypothetical protein